MSETPNLGLPVMEAAQAQKHVTHNEALLLLDAQIHLSVISRSLNTPPGSVSDGDRYLLTATPAGAWAGHAGDLAFRQSGGWVFAAPRAGWRLWVEQESKFLLFDGSTWRDLQQASDTMPKLGINATADTSNRLTVSADATLLNHAGGDHRLKVNKDAAGDTASLLFQSGFSGRAELGLAGDNDFRLKVSPDGSVWNEAIVIDRTTGEVTMPHTSGGVTNGDRGDIAVSSGVWHYMRTNGSPGDGVSDDAPYWNTMLAAGKTVVLSDRKSYIIRTPVIPTVAGTGIIAPHGATVKMATAAGAFDNTVYADRYSATTAGGKKYAVGISASNLQGLVFKGFKIQPDTWIDDRYLKAFSFLECDYLDLTDIEASLFSRSQGVITLNDCDWANILRADIHDCYSSSTSISSGTSASAQITAIEIDGDAVAGSKYGRILDFRIRDLTRSEAGIIAFGCQIDGINAQGPGQSTKPTLGWIIKGGQTYNLGEAVDWFGRGSEIVANSFVRSFDYGVKLAHSATDNLVEANQIAESGLAAVVIGPSYSVTGPASGNMIIANKVRGVNPSIDWVHAGGGFSWQRSLHGGQTYWDSLGGGTSVFRVDPGNAATRTSTPENTMFADNDATALCSQGGSAYYGFAIDGEAGGSPVFSRDNRIRNFTVSFSADPMNYLRDVRTDDVFHAPVRFESSGSVSMGVPAGAPVEASLQIRRDQPGGVGPQLYLQNRAAGGGAGTASEIVASSNAVNLAQDRNAAIRFESNGANGNDIVFLPNESGSPKIERGRFTPAGLDLSGTPTAPTAATGTSTAQIATTAFVRGEIAGCQPLDSELTALASLASSANTMPYFTGAGTAALAALTAAGRNVIGAADPAAQRSALGLGTAATVNTGTSGAAVPLLNAANTFAAGQRIGDGTAAANFIIDGAAALGRFIDMRSAGNNRFRLALTSTESGGNAGSNFSVQSYDDAGVSIETPLSILRSSGTTTLKALSLTNALPIGSGGTGATTAAAARTNLGLGTAATSSATDFAAAIHTHTASAITDSTAAGRAMLTAPDAAAQTSFLDAFTTTLKGLVPASGGGTVNFLRADGTWAAPPAGGSVAWGSITGSLASQTDLQAALAAKSTSAFNQSLTSQGPGFATDTYLAGSGIALPPGLKAGSCYRVLFDVSKTAAGTASPVVTLRFGTSGTTADGSLATLTFPVQTAAADDGVLQLFVTFRSVGSGTSAVVQTVGQLSHTLTSTGLANSPGPVRRSTSAGFNSTLAGGILGVSVNAGASAAWTVSLVQASLENLN